MFNFKPSGSLCQRSWFTLKLTLLWFCNEVQKNVQRTKNQKCSEQSIQSILLQERIPFYFPPMNTPASVSWGICVQFQSRICIKSMMLNQSCTKVQIEPLMIGHQILMWSSRACLCLSVQHSGTCGFSYRMFYCSTMFLPRSSAHWIKTTLFANAHTGRGCFSRHVGEDDISDPNEPILIKVSFFSLLQTPYGHWHHVWLDKQPNRSSPSALGCCLSLTVCLCACLPYQLCNNTRHWHNPWA